MTKQTCELVKIALIFLIQIQVVLEVNKTGIRGYFIRIPPMDYEILIAETKRMQKMHELNTLSS